MSKMTELLKEIKDGLTQVSSSQKDEVRVMQMMLNDREYAVGVYDKDGKKEDYCPSSDYRKMLGNVVASTTKIGKEEAAQLVDKYEATKADAITMVGISKEFINTYLDCGRKLPLGGREKSSYELSIKVNAECEKKYPKLVGTDANGKGIYESTPKKVPAHKSIKAHGSCPSWVK
ncbi:MAG: hypothetical protein PHC62_00750 [Candidatus Izemoplasmatales bacterium]|nr:hypothetical protein [Candidatus Izemoplasmatales bacterium]